MNTAAMRCALACGLSILAAAHAGAAGVAPHSFTLDDFASVEKVDVHVHINSSDSALIDQAALDHFRLLTITVDSPDFPPLAEQLRIAQVLPQTPEPSGEAAAPRAAATGDRLGGPPRGDFRADPAADEEARRKRSHK